MIRLIRAELYKIFKGRTFKVLLIIALILGILPIVADATFSKLDTIESQNPNIQIGTMEENKVSDEIILGNFGMSTAFVKDPLNITSEEIFYVGFGHGITELFIVILVGALFASEYSHGTIKNTLAYGKKRRDFYLAKFLGVLLAILLITAIMTLTPVILNSLVKGGFNLNTSQIIGMTKSFLGVGLISAATISLIMLLSLVLKSNGPTVAIGVGILLIVPTFLSAFASNKIIDKIVRLTVLYNSTVVRTMGISLEQFNRSLLIGIITLVCALLLGIIVFNRQDIK